MFQFKAYDVNLVRKSSYNEGDNNEFMEAFINVYENGNYDGLQIYINVKGNKGYFRWCSDKIHEFYSLRNAANEVIQGCVETIKKSTNYNNRKFLDGTAHSILNSLFV